MVHAAEWLGGKKVLRAEIRTEMDLIRVVREGLPTAAVDEVSRRGKLTMREIERIIPRRTLAHRRKNQQSLSQQESDHLARVARTMAMAEETFQDREKANVWMRRPNRTLQGETPIDLLDTEPGARLVENVLGQITYGIF